MTGRLDALRGRLGPLWWHSLLFFAASRFGDLCNLYVGLFLVPASLPPDQLGAVLPVTRLATFVGVPLLIVVQGATKFLNVFLVRGERGKIKRLMFDLCFVTVGFSALAAVYLAAARRFVHARLKIDDPAVLWLVGALAIVSCWAPVVQSASQGLGRFRAFTAASAARPVVRLAVVALLLRPLQLAGYLTGTLVSSLVFIGLLVAGMREFADRRVRAESYRRDWSDMLRYLAPLGVYVVAGTVQQTVEPWVVRQRLPPADSAGFYMASMFGLIPGYLAGAVVPFLFPIVSARAERSESTRDLHRQVIAAILGAGGMVTVGLAVAGPWILDLHPVWRGYAAYAPLLWRLSLASTLDSAVLCHATHETARRRFGYVHAFAWVAAAEAAVLYGLMGWSFFRPWLPRALWEAVARLDVRNLGFVVGVMIVSRAAVLAGTLLPPWASARRPAPPESGRGSEV